MRNMGGRHELKYYINDADLIELWSRLPFERPNQRICEK